MLSSIYNTFINIIFLKISKGNLYYLILNFLKSQENLSDQTCKLLDLKYDIYGLTTLVKLYSLQT